MIYPQEAIRKANLIIRKYHARNPEELAEDLGIMVIPSSFANQKGIYTVIKRQPIIFIKEDLDPVMYSIVLAHEIGHHILHRKEAVQQHGFKEFHIFDMKADRMEYEANVFAAQLMLPDDEILEYIDYGYDCAQIACAMNSDINLVALKISAMNCEGYHFREQDHNSKFLK